MAATHTANRAQVTTPEAQWGPVRLRIWGNVATVRHQTSGATLHVQEGVKAVGKPARQGAFMARQIEFEDGTVWEVLEPRKGCGCGAK